MGEEKSAVGGFFFRRFLSPHKISFLSSLLCRYLYFSLLLSLPFTLPLFPSLFFASSPSLSISIFFLLLVPSPRSLPYLPLSFLSLSLSCLFACRHRKKSPMQLFFFVLPVSISFFLTCVFPDLCNLSLSLSFLFFLL